MSGDHDRKLAGLLARGPQPPPTLDPERRQALLAEAKRSWFRARAAQRRWLWAGAAAAGIVLALTVWSLNATGGGSVMAPPTQVSRVERKREEAAPAATPPPAAAWAAAPAAPAAPPPPVVASAPAAAKARPMADGAADAPAAPAAAPLPAPEPEPQPVVASRDLGRARQEAKATFGMRAMPAEQADGLAAPAPAAAAVAAEPTDLPETLLIPADAPERGKLLAAAAIVHAARTRILAPADRAEALQAAIDLIARIRHPAADDLRRRIAIELRRR